MNKVILNPEKEEIFRLDKISSNYFIYFLWYKKKLVYIGQTTNLTARIKSHLECKVFDSVTYTNLDCETKEEVLAIEKENIEYYNPLYNFNPTPWFKEDGIIHFHHINQFLQIKPGEVLKIYNEDDSRYDYFYFKEAKIYRTIYFFDTHSVYYCNKRSLDEYPVKGFPKAILKSNIKEYQEKELELRKEKEKCEEKKKKHFVTKVKDDSIIKFGKYKGSMYKTIANQDTSYIKWLFQKNIITIDESTAPILYKIKQSMT